MSDAVAPNIPTSTYTKQRELLDAGKPKKRKYWKNASFFTAMIDKWKIIMF